MKRFKGRDNIRSGSIVKVSNGHHSNWYWVFASCAEETRLAVLDPLSDSMCAERAPFGTEAMAMSCHQATGSWIEMEPSTFCLTKGGLTKVGEKINEHNEMNRRKLILGATAAMGGAFLTGCGGGSDPQDETQVPVSDTHLYRTLMALRFGMNPAEVIAAVGRAPDLLPMAYSQRWTEGGQTLTVDYRKRGNYAPQLSTATWKWSPKSKSAYYSFRLDGPPAFLAAP